MKDLELKFLDHTQQTIGLTIPVEVSSHNISGEAKDFIDAIHEGRNVISGGINGASTASVCFAIVESFKTGSKVKVDCNFE